MRLGSFLILAALAAFPACSKKDGSGCAVPEALPHPMLEGPTREQPRRLLSIGGYTLAVSWSPQYCASRMTSPADHLQCGGEMGQFGFTLHGLWPDGEAAPWPQYCTPTRLVPDAVVRQNLCSTPSVQLIQHQWERHGTCIAQKPAEYFATAERLYRALKYPDMAALRGKTIPAKAFLEAFAAANPGMKADQIRLKTSRDGWLEEVLLCLDKTLGRQACPVYKAGANAAAFIRIRQQAPARDP